MRCSRVEKKLAEYVDGLLDGRDREAIEAHLAHCGACRQAATDVEVGMGALGLLGPVRAPASFAPRVNGAVREASPKALAPTLIGRDLRVALTGAASIVVLTLMLRTQLPGPSPYVASAGVPSAASEAMELLEPALPVMVVATETTDAPRSQPQVSRRAPKPRPSTRGYVARRPRATPVSKPVSGRSPTRESLAPKETDTAGGGPVSLDNRSPVVEAVTATRGSTEFADTSPRLAGEPGSAAGADTSGPMVLASSAPHRVLSTPEPEVVLVAEREESATPVPSVELTAGETKSYGLSLKDALREDPLRDEWSTEAT